MKKKMCILMLVHKPLTENTYLFNKFSSANFYIHVDAKSDFQSIYESCKEFQNVFFLDCRVDIKWAGFSMVRATLNLMTYALDHDVDNEYFHLISGDDVILSEDLIWDDNKIYMDFRLAQENRYRMRFNSIFADTSYQRSRVSKILTQIMKFFDKYNSTSKKYYMGSQWFSIRREQLVLILDSITQNDINFFAKKLCPDEHFFQYLVEKNNLIEKLSIDNKRFLIFDKNHQNGSSPISLSLEQLLESKKKGFWFARKVDQKVMNKFYNLERSFEI
ncbi:beta-1,6-N-acetylglucosaminyltransferase [Acinetobacter gyllenbergii]|uniref:beta-1,6-N-acetylglucosaminyltransferase n=1 Tax=Acinetobacter gyllenbergii TaxID=134534 RepID=UPI0005193EB5|nr:beta-1,6-N-acetylglucosaminyltransferase [Acinetobacter gyllenbergii]